MINSLPQAVGDSRLIAWPAAMIVLNFLLFDNVTWRGMTLLNCRYQSVIKNRIIRETLADSIEQILHRISSHLVRGISPLAAAFIATYQVPLFFYILFIWSIFFSSFSIWTSKKYLVYLADIHADKESALSGQLVDCLTNQRNIRIFAKKEDEISRMESFFFPLQKAFQRKEFFLFVLNAIEGLMIAVMMGFSTYFLVYLCEKGLITIGDFVLILGLSQAQ